MAVIFGNKQATGIFAKGTNDPLASQTSESASEAYAAASCEFGSESRNTSPRRDGADSSGQEGSGRKRGRAALDDDPMISSVTDAFNNLANAIRITAPRAPPTVPHNIWDIMKDIPAFDEGDLAHYYAYLYENQSLANAFAGLTLDNKMVWVSRYIKNHLS